jgi:hypothetical protein
MGGYRILIPVKGDQKGHHRITHSVQQFLKTAHVINAGAHIHAAARANVCVCRIYYRINGCWRAARDIGALLNTMGSG